MRISRFDVPIYILETVPTFDVWFSLVGQLFVTIRLIKTVRMDFLSRYVPVEE